MIAQHDAANGTLTFLYDGHGSTRALLDEAAQVVQRFAYDAYGNMLSGTGLTAASAALTHLLYSGEWTNSTGQQYLRARWYDPASGTFNRLDPFAGNMQDPQSLHKYAYGFANPVLHVDPSGNLPHAAILGVIATLLGGAVFGGISYSVGGGGGQIASSAGFGALGLTAVSLAAPTGRGIKVAGAGVVAGFLNYAVAITGDYLRQASGRAPLGGPPSKAKYWESFSKGFGVGSWEAYLSFDNQVIGVLAPSALAAISDIGQNIAKGESIDWAAAFRTFAATAAIGALTTPKVVNMLPAMRGHDVDEVTELASSVFGASGSFFVGVDIQLYIEYLPYS